MRIHPASIAVTSLVLAASLLGAHPARADGSPGLSGSMQAYYDHRLFMIMFKEFTASEATLLAKNGQQNTIWRSDAGLPGGLPFVAVIDAIPGDGMNPLWAEVQIAFTTGNTPRQLFSDDEVNAAAAAGEITLTPTGEMYQCAVFGPPPPASASPVRAARALVRPAAGAFGASGAAATSTWGRLKLTYR